MKRNSKRFLALFMAVSMSVTPTTVLHAEESSETDQIQNVEIKQDENKTNKGTKDRTLCSGNINCNIFSY